MQRHGMVVARKASNNDDDDDDDNDDDNVDGEENEEVEGRRWSRGTSSAAPGGDYDNAGRRFGAVKII